MNKRLQAHFRRRARYVAREAARIGEFLGKDIRRSAYWIWADAKSISVGVHESISRASERLKEICAKLDAIADEESDALMESSRKDILE